MEKRGWFLTGFVLLIIVILVIVFLLLNKNSSNLPDDFNINIHQDATSSGATRLYSANLTFRDGKLDAGVSSVFMGNTVENECVDNFSPVTNKWTNTINRKRQSVNGNWTEWEYVADSLPCSLYEDILIKADLEKKIKDKSIVPDSECVHYGAPCYTLTI